MLMTVHKFPVQKKIEAETVRHDGRIHTRQIGDQLHPLLAEGAQLRQCACDCVTFYILLDGHQCSSCGAFQVYD
jgi:hypothetical protein